MESILRDLSCRRNVVLAFLGIVWLLFFASVAGATVLSGAIVELRASTGFSWGDGAHDLNQVWSVNEPESSGFFFGSALGSNADIYVYRGLTDPTHVMDAQSLPYTAQSDWAGEGDMVFFRGTNGYYGAWRIDAITPCPGEGCAVLSGQWYFQDDGGADFSGGVPVHVWTWGEIQGLFR